MSSRLGVGIVGAGPVTQAIHLPVLATLTHKYRVVRIMDVDPVTAISVAAGAGAEPATTLEEVLEDPAVDVVAITSPNKFHAGQLVATCRAGKRGVMCEKPLAISLVEADAVDAAASETGTPVVVGAMHVYDPAVRAAFARWEELGETASLVLSTIYLPGNDIFIGQATEQMPAQPPPADRVAPPSPTDADRLRAGILGLASHAIPLVRSAVPTITSLGFAQPMAPWGYGFGWAAGNASVEMFGVMRGSWGPDWRLRVVGQKHEMRISFPPSYVLAGSARAEIVGPDKTEAWEFGQNGYQALWTELYAEINGSAPIVPFARAVDDLRFTLHLADLTEKLLGGTAA